ncbi:hypothetical protein V2J79_15965 [Pseudomonas alliivorans]|nr:hypothetical protein [Pseudomonas alliivorans]MEE5070724.1 hypothetical protein [Pseudomonas alliivorans]
MFFNAASDLNVKSRYAWLNNAWSVTVIMLDGIPDAFFNLLAHSIGVRILKALSGGRFKGERGFAWGWALVVGSVALIAPLVAFITWLIVSRSAS